MIFVIDTNILFSACLTPAGKIFEILFNTPSSVELISCHYAIVELSSHKEKLIKLSGLTEEDIDILIGSILKQIDFFNEEIIESHHWIEADRLTKDVDRKDINFVALTLQNNAILWTGDKKLTNHLKFIGFDHVINTSELIQVFNIG